MRLLPEAGAIVLVALALSVTPAHAAGPPCSPLTYGATGDGVTDNTAAIQSAIDACEATYGGGVVRLNVENGRGTYLSGPIRLANHIRLQLDKDVTLLGTTDHSKYQSAFLNHPFHASEALVSAYRAIDTGIIGPGTIDGQGGMPAADGGPAWWASQQPRPWLVEFYQCTGVTVNDVSFTNAPMWNLALRYSKYITVSELRVSVTPDPMVAHTDGIDVVGSSDATLIFLDIRGGGDSVALKSGLPVSGEPDEAGLPQLPTHDIQIVNSRLANGNGIVLGGEAANGVYNVLARNITEADTRHGLLIRSDRSRGNHAVGIYNVLVDNMTLTGTRQPLVIDASAADADGSGDSPRPVTALTPNIHDITVMHLSATGAEEAGAVLGLPEACIRRVKLDDVTIATSGAGLQLRQMTGSFTNVSIAPHAGPPFVVQESVTVGTAGTTPAITNTPPNCGD